MRVPPLTEAEKNRWYSKFFYERYQPAPEALAEIGDNGPMGLENALSAADRLNAVKDGYFQRERGWQVMPDGTTFVAGFIFMKDVTPDNVGSVLDQAVVMEQKNDNMRDKYFKKQLQRLKKGKCKPQSGIVFSEVLTDFERMGDHTLNIAQQYKEMAQ